MIKMSADVVARMKACRSYRDGDEDCVAGYAPTGGLGDTAAAAKFNSNQNVGRYGLVSWVMVRRPGEERPVSYSLCGDD